VHWINWDTNRNWLETVVLGTYGTSLPGGTRRITIMPKKQEKLRKKIDKKSIAGQIISRQKKKKNMLQEIFDDNETDR
jgi:uncharacterized membrane protein